jgi:preprotein translocase subunit YajC
MAGKISEIDDNFVTLEVADSVNVVVQRGAVATVLPKGTLRAS